MVTVLIITKEIKKYGIHVKNGFGDWCYIPPKQIKFFDNGRKMKCLGYEFDVRKDINTLYIISKEFI